MNIGQKQIIAEKISSTVRALELLGLDYEVSGPRNLRKRGNKSPRVVTVKFKDRPVLRVYNGVGGHTWANWDDGPPVVGVGSVEKLYAFLSSQEFAKKASGARSRVKKRSG